MATGTLGGCDYSYSPPNYAEAVRAGVHLFARYLSPSSGKDFTVAELRTIHSLGAGALMLWEGYAEDAAQGYNEGYANGAAAVAKVEQLQAGLGYAQRNTPGVAFAVDFDVPTSQYPQIVAYFRGVRAAVGGRILIGVYGSARLIDYLIGVGVCDFGFQTYAWSYGVVSSNAHIYQYLNGQNAWGGTVDFCEVRDLSKLGAWFAPGSINDTDGDEMTPADWTKMQAELAANNKKLMGEFREALGHALATQKTAQPVGFFTRKRFPRLFRKAA